MSLSKIRERLSCIKVDIDEVNDAASDIQRDIHTETQRAEDAECEVKSLTARLVELDESTSNKEDELKKMKARIRDIEAESDENSRFNRVLESRAVSNNEKLTDLQRQVTQQMTDIDRLDKQNSELQEKSREVEGALEDAEERECHLKSLLGESTEELYQLRNSVTSLHASGTKMISSEEWYQKTISKLTEDLEETTSRLERAVDGGKALQKQTSALEDELDVWNDKVKVSQTELEQIYSEINEI